MRGGTLLGAQPSHTVAEPGRRGYGRDQYMGGLEPKAMKGMQMPTGYHEPANEMSAEARDLHRAMTSLIEEIEAVDWYNQRVDVTKDESLRAVLAHNRDEEIEHAAMTLEWLRRRMPKFDAELRTYLFTEAPITEVEDAAGEAGPEAGENGAHGGDLGLGKFTKEG